MARKLDGMVCLITGASSGIGEELARQLATKGAKLALVARRREKLEKLATELPGEHLVYAADVGDSEACRGMVEATFEQFGRLDTLVANAGYGISKASWKHTPDETRKLFAVNVFGTLDAIHYAVPRMIGQSPARGYRGQLVLVSSAAARRGLPFFGPYSATKAAQLSLAEALRVELDEHAIAVTSVHPIGTRTSFFDVAERGGGTKVGGIGSRGSQQTPQHVARRMVRAIRRPTREVWPAKAFRYALGMTAFSPWLGDRVMSKMKRQIDDAAAKSSKA